MYQKTLKIILTPNYFLNFTINAINDLELIYNYCFNISRSYYNKIRREFYNHLSLISYNPFACQKLQSNLERFKDCRRCICSNFIIVYRIYDNFVEIINIFYSKSNYIR